MEELKEIYERMTFLRQKGIKMKDMAERAGFSPSVLSAIYSTVLPAYFKNLEKGMSEEEALHNALVWVNNVSKKKLLGSLVRLKDSLFSTDYQAKAVHEDTDARFLPNWKTICRRRWGVSLILVAFTPVIAFLRGAGA